MKIRVSKKKRKVSWNSAPTGVLKFNADGAARGKPRLAGSRGMLRNHKRKVLYMFSKAANKKGKQKSKKKLELKKEIHYKNLKV